MSNAVVPSKAGNRVALEVVWVGADTRDNKPCGLVGLVLRPALAFSLVAFEEALLAEGEDSEAVSAATGAGALAIGEASVATEVVVAMVIEEVLVAEAVSDIRVVVDSEAEVGIRMVLLRPTRPVAQVVVPVVGTEVNQTAALHQTTAIAAATATLIESHTVEPARRLEVRDKTAVTNGEASREAIENRSSLETEAMVEIVTATATATVTGNGIGAAIGIGMAAGDDGTMTLAQENVTTKVMAMMIREANEGIESTSLRQTVRQQQQHNQHGQQRNGFLGGYYPRCYSIYTSRLSFSTQLNGLSVGTYMFVFVSSSLHLHHRLRLPLRLFRIRISFPTSRLRVRKRYWKPEPAKQKRIQKQMPTKQVAGSIHWSTTARTKDQKKKKKPFGYLALACLSSCLLPGTIFPTFFCFIRSKSPSRTRFCSVPRLFLSPSCICMYV
jgi:hypothetical protein